MFNPDELPALKQAIRQATVRDRRLLDDLRSEVRALAGEVRAVSFSEKRQKAAKELGFNKVLLPKMTGKVGLTQYPAQSIKEALEICQRLS